MPLSVTETAGNNVYGNPFLGPVDHTVQIPIDISDLTVAEVDANGYLKPGVPFNRTGDTVTAGEVYGVTVEATKIVAAGPTDVSLAANTGTATVALATIAQIQRDIAEDNLGRAYTAAEIAGFAAAGSRLTLTNT